MVFWAQGATEAREQRIPGSGAGALGQNGFGVNPFPVTHARTALLNGSDAFTDI